MSHRASGQRNLSIGLLHLAPGTLDLHGQHLAGLQAVVLGPLLLKTRPLQAWAPPHQSEMGTDTWAKTIPSSTSLSIRL